MSVASIAPSSSLPVAVIAAASRVFSRSSSSTRYPLDVTCATTTRTLFDPMSIAAMRGFETNNSPWASSA